MNIKEYKDKKARGLAEVVKAGGGYAFAVKRFSKDDGIELTPEIQSINEDGLNQRMTELESEKSDILELLEDIQKFN